MENNYTLANYVLTVMPDICVDNGKDPAATELLNKMRLYGKVVPLAEVEATIRAEFQGTIDRLTKQYQAIAAQELTPDEIVFLNCYRELKVANREKDQQKIELLENGIEEMRVASLKRAEQIAALAEQLREMGS